MKKTVAALLAAICMLLTACGDGSVDGGTGGNIGGDTDPVPTAIPGTQPPVTTQTVTP